MKLCSCLVLLAVVSPLCFGLSEVPRVLRRKDRTYVADEIKQEGCPSRPAFSMMMVGERDDPEMLFSPLDPGLPTHTRLLHFTQNDIDQLYSEAAEFFLEAFGVDFVGVPTNDMGIREIPGWTMEPRRIDMNLRVVYTSDNGFYDCPLSFGDEGIRLAPTDDNQMFRGTFGGEEGVQALFGDMVAYASVAVDLDGDGDYERMPYWSVSPFRPVDGQFVLNCAMWSDRYGLGAMEGKIAISPSPDNVPHAHFRMMATFPARFDLELWTPPAVRRALRTSS